MQNTKARKTEPLIGGLTKNESDGPATDGTEISRAASEGEWELAQIAQNACADGATPACTASPCWSWNPSSNPQTCAAWAEFMSKRNTAQIQLSRAQARVCVRRST
jgi:hypothetical protein